MPRVSVHHHPCFRCQAKTECPSTWEENYDGWPGVICREYHTPGGINTDFVCEDCVNCRHDWRMSGAGVKECRTCGAEANDDAA